MLCPIANLCNFDNIMEKLISELLISDMQEKLDPAQFGNQKHTSIQKLKGGSQCCIVPVY